MQSDDLPNGWLAARDMLVFNLQYGVACGCRAKEDHNFLETLAIWPDNKTLQSSEERQNE